MPNRIIKYLLISAGILALLISAFFLYPKIIKADITTGLVGYWKFDEGSGTTAADSSGNNNTGTVNGGAAWTTGKLNQALSFDRANDYVNAGSASSLDNIETTGSGLTVSAWIYARSYGYGNNGMIVSKGSANMNGHWRFMFAGAANYLIFVKDYSGANDLYLYVDFPASYFNIWKHVVVTWDGSTSASNIHIFINGVQAATKSSSDGVGGKVSDASNFLAIGAADDYGSGNYFFDGLIDEVRIYNRALSASDVSELYNYTGGGTPTPTSSPTPTPSPTATPSATPTPTPTPSATPTPTPDTTPPVRSNGFPSGTLSSGITQTTLSLTTNENATCRYSTVANTAYSSMTNTFSTTGGTSHSMTITGLSNGNTYNYYIRCQDAAGNANTDDYTITFSVATSGGATTYWVSPTGAAANLAACSGATPLSGTSACSYDKANGSGVAAGDTVYYRAGTYSGITGTVISPYNNGTSGSRITFSAYNNEVVTFVGGGPTCTAVNLPRTYIKVSGIIFQNFYHHLVILSGSYNEIENCTFDGMYGLDWRGSNIMNGSHHNWIHGSTFTHYGYFGGGDDAGVPLEIGYDSGPNPGIYYNVLDNNIFAYGGHHVVGLQGIQTVFRNNYMHNENWSDFGGTLYGNRVLYSIGDLNDDGQNLIEGNRIAYGGQTSEATDPSGEGILLSTNSNIIRYNEFVRNYLNAMYVDGLHGGQSGEGRYNAIYNNSFWYVGYYEGSSVTPNKPNFDNAYTHGLLIDEKTNNSIDNLIANNIFYQGKNAKIPLSDLITEYIQQIGDWRVPILQDLRANWYSTSGDPKFVSITGTPNPTNRTQYDFRLQSNSSCINAGTYLTETNGAGTNSTTLTVNNAYPFQDGWGTWPSGGPAVYADWICIGTVNNCVQIDGTTTKSVTGCTGSATPWGCCSGSGSGTCGIDYTNKKLYLASPITWSNGANIWLYKNSSGQQVLSGSAPDYGAHEYISGSTDTTPPAAPTGVAVN